MTDMLRDKFKRVTKTPETVPTANPGNVNVLVITREQAVTGNVTFDGTAQIDGSVEGNVQAERVVVTAHAVVNGTVTGKTVRVDGTVNGPIKGETIILAPTACVKGNIDYESLSIVSGASVFGLCRDKRESRSATEKSSADAVPIPFNLIKRSPLRPTMVESKRPATPAPAPLPAHPARPASGTMMDVWEAYEREDQPAF